MAITTNPTFKRVARGLVDQELSIQEREGTDKIGLTISGPDGAMTVWLTPENFQKAARRITRRADKIEAPEAE